MLVHQVRAFQQLNEVFLAQIQHDGQADGRPQAVSSAHPIPKFKHMLGVDAEFGNGFLVGGNGDKVLGDVFFAACLQEPIAGGVGVGERFLGGERFGCDDEQRGFGVDFFQHVAHLRAVHIGNEVHIQARMPEVFQRGAHHQRPQIRAADADIDHIGDDLVGVAQPFAAAHGAGEVAHFAQNVVHFGHHVFTVHLNRRVAAVAQGNVQHGAVFGFVDFFAAIHLLNALGQPRLLG